MHPGIVHIPEGHGTPINAFTDEHGGGAIGRTSSVDLEYLAKSPNGAL